MVSLKEKINELISKKYEGAYWDYKQQYHENRADLLHDIICLANNTENRDAYLIFGITDDGRIVGVENDPNRKNQENFISFLREKDFEGGYRPVVEYNSLELGNDCIDVLIIKQSNRTPYFLTKDYSDGKKKVRAYHIYSRIMDTNTPKDKSADEKVVENLWKRRFGLLPLPIDRLKHSLSEKKKWTINDSISYYNPSPEFTIEQIYDYEDRFDNTNREFYSYYQTNSSTSYGTLQCKYYMTVLFECQSVVLDSGRYVAPVPSWGFIPSAKNQKEKLSYKYYVKGSLKYQLNIFLFDENSEDARYSRNNFMELVLLYNSEEERKLFESHIEKKITDIVRELNEIEKHNLVFEGVNERVRAFENKRIHTGILLNKELLKFRREYSYHL
ncbi:AlbA family DNA-binding domain-containing protein [Savagea serpentis]|uniref:AlbA family DNA-binding domain-containing protein n=1 Tax=Savagea serpentis TaxID=2785297 RepID=UPI00188A4301|nr:ATP-binding protein [Savagea serpentis]